MTIDPFSAISSSTSAPAGMKITTPEEKKLWQASKAMESLFSGYMLGEVGKSLPGVKEGAGGSEIYADMFKQAIADQMAESHSLGLADMIYKGAVEKLPNDFTSDPQSNAPTSIEAAIQS